MKSSIALGLVMVSELNFFRGCVLHTLYLLSMVLGGLHFAPTDFRDLRKPELANTL